MKAILSCCVTLLLGLGAAPAQAGGHTLEPFVLLDNFSGDRIDKTIWNGSRRPESHVLDFAREVRDGRLRLMNRSYNDSGFGGTNSSAVRLFLNNSDRVTAVRAWFRIKAVEMRGCTDPSTGSATFGWATRGISSRVGPTSPMGVLTLPTTCLSTSESGDCRTR